MYSPLEIRAQNVIIYARKNIYGNSDPRSGPNLVRWNWKQLDQIRSCRGWGCCRKRRIEKEYYEYDERNYTHYLKYLWSPSKQRHAVRKIVPATFVVFIVRLRKVTDIPPPRLRLCLRRNPLRVPLNPWRIEVVIIVMEIIQSSILPAEISSWTC